MSKQNIAKKETKIDFTIQAKDFLIEGVFVFGLLRWFLDQHKSRNKDTLYLNVFNSSSMIHKC